MDGEKDTKTTVYNMKKDARKGGRKKRKKSEMLKKDNNKKREFHIIDHTIRTYQNMLFVSVHE